MQLHQQNPWYAFLALLLASTGAVACSSDSTNSTDGTGSTSLGRCGFSAYSCDGTRATRCSGATAGEAVDCAAKGQQCNTSLGCVSCQPKATSCANGKATLCREDGQSTLEFDCDATQGMKCAATGCTGSCAPPTLGPSYLGCDYYPTVTPNPVWKGFEFAIAVANAGSKATHATVTRGSSTIVERNLAPGEVALLPLPWVDELKGGDVDVCQKAPAVGASRRVVDGAYRVRTDQPVTVYQFSPLTYELKGAAAAGCPVASGCLDSPGTSECLSYSNDASLLLPATALTGSYSVLSWPSSANGAGFYSVTATHDGTEVTLQGRGVAAAGAAVAADGSGTVKLDRGDVLLVTAQASSDAAFGADLTGTLVTANHPVQVIGGNSCANIPSSSAPNCDHVEHSMLPAETLGKRYVVAAPAALAPTPAPHTIRIVAVQQKATVKLSPALVSSATGKSVSSVVLEPGGEFFESRDVTADVVLDSDQPIQVARYLEGQSALPSKDGDPSMAVAVPVEQFRRSYLFVASKTYFTSFAEVIAPKGATVTLDGRVLLSNEFTAIGKGDWLVARVDMRAEEDVHSLSASAPVGLMVYGYGRYTSYLYVGGLDLVPRYVPLLR